MLNCAEIFPELFFLLRRAVYRNAIQPVQQKPEQPVVEHVAPYRKMHLLRAGTAYYDRIH